MFKDLRQNVPFYLLHRGETPKLETGQVLSVSQPMPKMPANYNAMYPQQPEMVVDVRVKVGENTLTLEKLPAGNSIADFSSGGIAGQTSNMVVSSDRELIRTEIESMLSQSRSVIGSVAFHEKVITESEKILKTLNPSFAKEKEQEETIKGLQERITGLEGGIGEIKQMLLSSQKTQQETKKQQQT